MSTKSLIVAGRASQGSKHIFVSDAHSAQCRPRAGRCEVDESRRRHRALLRTTERVRRGSRNLGMMYTIANEVVVALTVNFDLPRYEALPLCRIDPREFGRL